MIEGYMTINELAEKGVLLREELEQCVSTDK